MPNEGYIKLYRQIMDNSFLWNNEPFTRGQAWIDILLWAAHSDHDAPFDGGIIEIKRSTYVTSIRKLCERWKWSNTKVTRFLDVLQSEKMLVVFSDAKKTVLTVINWDIYQPIDDAKTPLKRHRNATETPLKHTDNNGENVENGNNDIKEVYGEFQNVHLSVPDYEKLCKEYTPEKTQLAIEFLSAYKVEKPKYKTQSDYLTMRRWVFDAVSKTQGVQPQKKKSSFMDL